MWNLQVNFRYQKISCHLDQWNPKVRAKRRDFVCDEIRENGQEKISFWVLCVQPTSAAVSPTPPPFCWDTTEWLVWQFAPPWTCFPSLWCRAETRHSGRWSARCGAVPPPEANKPQSLFRHSVRGQTKTFTFVWLEKYSGMLCKGFSINNLNTNLVKHDHKISRTVTKPGSAYCTACQRQRLKFHFE